MFFLRPRRLIKLNENIYIKNHVRFCGSNLSQRTRADTLDGSKLSLRQSQWKLAQERYAKHPLIIYSTKLEEQVEFMNYRQLRAFKYKEEMKEKRNRRKLQLQRMVFEPNIKDNEELEGEISFPINWMDDYEFYEGNKDGNHSTYGTADSRLSPSDVPCSGCGAHLHCTQTTLPGFIPVEIFKGRSPKELQTIICQRCHFLKNYNIALDMEISADSYVETISRIKDEHAFVMATNYKLQPYLIRYLI